MKQNSPAAAVSGYFREKKLLTFTYLVTNMISRLGIVIKSV